VKICLISDNEWVKDSIVKYLDFECSFEHFVNEEELNNNGGPSIIREIKQKKTQENATITLLIDREDDKFQATRVGADSYLLKPIEKTNLKNLFT
jgi:DNA-binding NarL/FixJ family response regulator